MPLILQVACFIFRWFLNLHRILQPGNHDVEMQKPTYIQTDTHTANLTELMMEKLESYERSNKVLMAKVCTMTNPINTAQLYTEKEAASMLSTSIKNLYNLRTDGKIHYHQVGINIRYSMGNILEYEESCSR